MHRHLNVNRAKRYQTLEEENSGELLINFEEDDDGLMRSSKKSTKRSESAVNFTHLTFPSGSSSEDRSPPTTSDEQSPTEGLNTTSSSSGCSSTTGTCNIGGKNNGVGRVRKSASVRFAVEQATNCPKMTTSTSDYASMDNFQAFTGFENPNYSGPAPAQGLPATTLTTPLVPKSDQIEMESMGKH